MDKEIKEAYTYTYMSEWIYELLSGRVRVGSKTIGFVMETGKRAVAEEHYTHNTFQMNLDCPLRGVEAMKRFQGNCYCFCLNLKEKKPTYYY